MKAFRSIFIASTKEYIRDGGLLFLSIIFPLVLIVIFGAVFNGTSKDMQSLTVGVVGGHGYIYDQFLKSYSENEIFFGG